jgi:hypothetical protein
MDLGIQLGDRQELSAAILHTKYTIASPSAVVHSPSTTLQHYVSSTLAFPFAVV